ncbi:ergosterol biosynthesis protein [Gnomoniopsis sp. IMI 355080]|nr:ergosterol biosynthesis protein [Gnomoniopsis sp. IMI 355080]
MDQLSSFLPSAEDGYLPYYLLLVSVAAIGNGAQNLFTLHYTRRIYNGLFVSNSSAASPDSVSKIIPAATAAKQNKPAAAPSDQVTPLAARLFGVYTILAGVIRVYGAYRVNDPALYQLCLFTHLLAVSHFTSEIVVFKTLKLGWEHAFPLSAGIGGSVWMTLQYSNYVR